ncbi:MULTISPECIES: CHAT domain-containing protein [unclassified Frankia]|uniref:CHAT domain-containing protein n=1 Tax=unclassified Frankia TaxID=2632575 RepID=UPI002AD43420|nr:MULTISPECIES: CHAT domain-containing protein [unclassified Frankia]
MRHNSTLETLSQFPIIGRPEIGLTRLVAREPTFTLPTPTEALLAAETYVRAELELGGNTGQRHRAMSRLGDILRWRARLGDTVDTEELERLESVATDDDPPVTPRIVQVAEEILRNADAGDYDRLKSLIDRTPPDLAIAALGVVMTRAAGHDDTMMLQLAEVRASLVDRHGDEQDREDQFVLEIGLVRAVYDPDLEQLRGLPEPLPLEDLTALAHRLSDGSPDTAPARSAWLIHIANLLVDIPSATGAAVDAFTAARSVTPDLAEAHPYVATYVEAKLEYATAAHALVADDPAAAADALVDALVYYVDLRLFKRAGDCLSLLNSLATRLTADSAFHVLGGLMVVNTVADDLDPQSGRLVQLILARLLYSLATTGVATELLAVLFQIAKGWRLHVMLADTPPPLAELDEDGKDLLARTAPAEGEMAPEFATLHPGFIDDDTILVSWSDTADRRPSASPADRLRLRRRRFDHHVTAAMRAGLQQVPTPMRLDQVQAALDARTVLLVYFSGGWTDDDIGTAYLLVTADEVAAEIRIDNAPPGDVFLRADDLTVTTSPIGVFVAELRRRVQTDPLTDLVDAEAGRMLASGVESYLGRLKPRLEELRRAGKDRLRIVPHGPLHYYPFHLVGPPGQPLASEWTVSYLPNIGLLRPRPDRGDAVPARTATITSFGLTYENDDRPRLPALPRAMEEAAAVAAVFGAEPVPEDAATKPTVLHALQHSRFVHISGHGEHDAEAPSFQCVYLNGTGDDAILFAHELLAYDLRGLELLTLSACETALGRLDRQDNLQGLPAALLLAGVQTIIGTQWDVSDEVAAVFFPALYRQLDSGSDVFDSFRTAQETTRASYPQYWDWGAFHLLGGVSR